MSWRACAIEIQNGRANGGVEWVPGKVGRNKDQYWKPGRDNLRLRDYRGRFIRIGDMPTGLVFEIPKSLLQGDDNA